MRIEIHQASTGYAVRILEPRNPWVYAECPTYREARDRAHSFARMVGGQVYSMLPVEGAPIKTRKLETLA